MCFIILCPHLRISICTFHDQIWCLTFSLFTAYYGNWVKLKILELQENFEDADFVAMLEKCLEKKPHRRIRKEELISNISALRNHCGPDSRDHFDFWSDIKYRMISQIKDETYYHFHETSPHMASL